jgi:hypothetical protein
VPAVIDHLVEVIGGLEPPILMGHSAGGIHPAHAGSRLRRGGRGDQLGCYRGRAHGAAVAAQDLQPPVLDQTTSTGRRPRSCWHPGWVSDVSGKTHPRRRPLTLPQTDRLRRLEVRQRGASRRSGWLRQSETTTGAIHLRRRGPPHAPAVSSAPTQGITTRDRGQRRILRLRPPAARPEGGRSPPTSCRGPWSTRGGKGCPRPGSPTSAGREDPLRHGRAFATGRGYRPLCDSELARDHDGRSWEGRVEGGHSRYEHQAGRGPPRP